MSTIQYNLHGLLRLPSGSLKIVEFKQNGIVNLGKFGIFEIDEIIGFPFGQSFEIIEDKKVRPITISTITATQQESEEADVEVGDVDAVESEAGEVLPQTLSEKIAYLNKLNIESSETNKNLIDLGDASQSLTMNEIEALKKNSTNNIGEEIIDKLIKSHVNFNKKTIHSQEKYLKRKQQKYLRRFTVEKIQSSQLLQYFIEKDANKVLDMSEETLGLILSLANVQPGGRYLVIDETGGVVISAMMERMGNEGEILVLHENEHPNHSALVHTDFSLEQQKKMVKNINLLQFFEPQEETIQWKDIPQEDLKEMKTNKRSHYYRRKQNSIDINASIENAQRGNFDGLIIASTLYLPTLLDKLIDKIGGSRPIIIYNQFKEPLLQVQIQSMEDLRLLIPTIHESKCRPYQTIPGRLHPLMSMRGGGGYVYSALRVFPIQKGVTAVGRGLAKKRKLEGKESI